MKAVGDTRVKQNKASEHYTVVFKKVEVHVPNMARCEKRKL